MVNSQNRLSAPTLCEFARKWLAGEPTIEEGELIRMLAAGAAAGIPEAREELLTVLARMDAGTKQ